MSNSFAGAKSYPVFAAALQSPCQLGANNCKQTMVAPSNGLFGSGTTPARSERPVPGAHSDHPLGGLKRIR